MRYTRLVIAAIDRYWLETALQEFCGFGTSVIACNAEVGVEKFLTPDETFDGREGASVGMGAPLQSSRRSKGVRERDGFRQNNILAVCCRECCNPDLETGQKC